MKNSYQYFLIILLCIQSSPAFGAEETIKNKKEIPTFLTYAGIFTLGIITTYGLYHWTKKSEQESLIDSLSITRMTTQLPTAASAEEPPPPYPYEELPPPAYPNPGPNQLSQTQTPPPPPCHDSDELSTSLLPAHKVLVTPLFLAASPEQQELLASLFPKQQARHQKIYDELTTKGMDIDVIEEILNYDRPLTTISDVIELDKDIEKKVLKNNQIDGIIELIWNHTKDKTIENIEQSVVELQSELENAGCGLLEMYEPEERLQLKQEISENLRQATKSAAESIYNYKTNGLFSAEQEYHVVMPDDLNYATIKIGPQTTLDDIMLGFWSKDPFLQGKILLVGNRPMSLSSTIQIIDEWNRKEIEHKIAEALYLSVEEKAETEDDMFNMDCIFSESLLAPVEQQQAPAQIPQVVPTIWGYPISHILHAGSKQWMLQFFNKIAD